MTSLISLSLLLQLGTKASSNPLFEGADPDIATTANGYWVFPTSQKGSHKLFSYHSLDLKHWTKHGPILQLKDIAWITADGALKHELWAPGIFLHDGRYYLFYSVGPQDPTPSRIGVAISTVPSHRFIDSGKPLITGGNGFEAIDAMVFRDPKTSNVYLYCGGSNGSKLRVYRLDSSLTRVVENAQTETPENFTEGAFMHFQKGVYYLSYSNGKWNDSSYSVCYSTAHTPIGPWTYKGKILQSDQNHAGPGHHAFFQDSVTREWYVIYHRWNNGIAKRRLPSARSVSINKVVYADNGDIIPITMGD